MTIIKVIEEEKNKIHQIVFVESFFVCIMVCALSGSDRRKKIYLHKSQSMGFIFTFFN